MAGANWSDLRARVLSALVMAAVGVTALVIGGVVWIALVIAVIAAMIWELARITAPQDPPEKPLMAAAITVLTLGGSVLHGGAFGFAALFIVPAAFAFTPRNLKPVAVLYALAILFAGAGLIGLRGLGVTPVLWLIAVVVASDVAGYFAGRSLGGPKFWPSISPKKTWSGTVAGWLAAGLVATVLIAFTGAPLALIPFSMLVAFAGQLGDILESWLKRRADIKDSSRLIPGHGGFLDRFDALLLAAVVIMLAGMLGPTPIPGAM